MVNEEGWRAPPITQYRPSSAVLMVPLDAIEATLAMLQAAGHRESGLFWYGIRGDRISTVTSVRAPRQKMNRGNYHITAEGMREMGASLADELRPLAQVHSHPGVLVEHSPYDDEMASSRRALSLVFPQYGRLTAAWPDGVGVHEWQSDYWHHLTSSQARSRVALIARTGVERIDFR